MNHTKSKQNNSLVIQLRDAIIVPKADLKFSALGLNIFILGKLKKKRFHAASAKSNREREQIIVG